MTEITAARKTRILVIDDYPTVVATLAYVLSGGDFGYGVITAGDGPSGLALAASEHPDLILLDFDMPHFNGLQVLEGLAADNGLKNIPVIVMSGRATKVVRELSLGAGAREVIHKPFELQSLKATILRHLPEKAA